MAKTIPFNSLWRDTAGDSLDNPALDQDLCVDIVVIGGGYTGVTAALNLVRKGCSVALLEAEDIGHGGSGRNVGYVNAGLWMEPEKVERQLGKAAGEKINSALAKAPALVFDTIERLGIECELTRSGTLHCAHSASGLSELKNRLRQYLARGAEVELLDRNATAAKTGTNTFHGAIWHKDVGTIQPLAYIRSLARAAVSAGVSLYQRSPVMSVANEGNCWQVRTLNHRVTADGILLATNGYHQNIPLAGATPCYTPVHYFQAATRPLSEDVLAHILPERQGCWDTAPIMSTIRRDAAGRLIVGGVGDLEGISGSVHFHWARRRLRHLFPELPDVELESAWHGRIAYSADKVPHIVNFGPRALSIFGYSGRGIGPGSVFGKAAAEYFASGDEDQLPVKPTYSYNENFTGLKRCFYEAGATATHGVTHLMR